MGISEEGSMTTRQVSNIGVGWRGFFMGIAEVIPGVSGGTIAFITGIYERLLNAIKAFDFALVSMLFRGDFKAAWAKIDGVFILSLVAGMVVGIVSGVFGVTYLLEQYPEVLWSLFFGCILASIPYIFSQISKLSAINIALFIASAVLAAFICMQKPIVGSENAIYVMMAGAIAISALMLPGVSGSFMLVLLGLYTTIIPSLKMFLTTFDFAYAKVVVFFGLGCIVGLVLFSRLLSYVYNTYRDGTLAVLCGFMLGSIIKVWPWRVPTEVLDKSTQLIRPIEQSELVRSIFHSEHLKITAEQMVLPGQYFTEPYLLGSILAMLAGISAVLLLWKFQQ